ncbi:hypothetical protein [Corynebacterium sp. H78]|uniref:hypothetical protein n=1 Tax=Corynebacterium sp. H78 TaxID=3133417 RepID=UPI0030A0EFEE
MLRPVPELRPAEWLRDAPSDIDWRDVGAGLIGVVTGPGFSMETAGQELIDRHTSTGQLHVVARPAAAATGVQATRLFTARQQDVVRKAIGHCPARRDLVHGLELGSPAHHVTGWLAATAALLELDGHLCRLFGDTPVYFPASVDSLLVFPHNVDLRRGYAWAAQRWKRSAERVSPLAFVREGDRLALFTPAGSRPDYRAHVEACALATGEVLYPTFWAYAH